MPTIQLLSIDNALLDDFCRRWKITKLQLFGSALRPDFNEASDVDLIVTFTPESNWGLFEHEGMEQELASLVGRKVDLISRRAVEASRNEIRRSAILDSAISVHEAR